MKTVARMRLFVVLSCLLCISPGASNADPYPGTLIDLTSSGTNVRDLFEVSADGMTLSVTGDAPGSPNGTSDWFLGGTKLVGIRSLFLVDLSGANPVAASVLLNAGFVKPSSVAGPPPFSWITKAGNGYSIFDNGAPGLGFKDGTHWLVVSNNAGLVSAGKSTSANKDRFGSFTFGSSLLNANDGLKYGIGLDWLGANGETQRNFISIQSVPEPAFYQFGTMLGLGVFGMARMRRKAKRAA